MTNSGDNEHAGAEVLQDMSDAALRWLLGNQQPEGFWVGKTYANSTIEAEWLIASHILSLALPDEDKIIKALLQRQRPDGSWDIYPGAPDGDKNSTIEVYAALRIKGFSKDAQELKAARKWILAHGGMTNLRVFTRYWLAMIGVWPWRHTPNLPPEIIRLPLWFPFSIYNFAQWARATMVPLAVISARAPVWPFPDASRLEELFVDGYDNFDFAAQEGSSTALSWKWLFRKVDGALHLFQAWGITPLRHASIRLCIEWMMRHQDADGGWGGIQPPWIYGLIVLVNEGYAKDHPSIAKAIEALSSHWSFEQRGVVHIQSTESPVWDTLYSLLSMHERGCTVVDSPAMQEGVRWILDQQVLLPGDWSLTCKAEPGGWAFERANVHYPDVDDTALAILVLAKVRSSSGVLQHRIDGALAKAVAWTLAMQSSNGGWAAFDKDNNKSIILKIPFCNFGEALDPPSVDVTAHVIEAFSALGYTIEHDALRRALEFIQQQQEKDGSWFGRWGVNHIYGTAAVLPALRALGVNMREPYILRAAEWIASHQNADGGWGETCASYMDPDLRGVGDSSPSQTAWGIMCLQSMDGTDYEFNITRAICYLHRTQTDDGTWDEATYTATGFPGYGFGGRSELTKEVLASTLGQGLELSRGFMLRFDMYRHYFPLLALGREASRRSLQHSVRRPTPSNYSLTKHELMAGSDLGVCQLE